MPFHRLAVELSEFLVRASLTNFKLASFALGAFGSLRRFSRPAYLFLNGRGFLLWGLEYLNTRGYRGT